MWFRIARHDRRCVWSSAKVRAESGVGLIAKRQVFGLFAVVGSAAPVRPPGDQAVDSSMFSSMPSLIVSTRIICRSQRVPPRRPDAPGMKPEPACESVGRVSGYAAGLPTLDRAQRISAPAGQLGQVDALDLVEAERRLAVPRGRAHDCLLGSDATGVASRSERRRPTDGGDVKGLPAGTYRRAQRARSPLT